MNPFDTFDENLFLKNITTKDKTLPDINSTLEDTLLSQILDLDPASPVKNKTQDKENIPPVSTKSEKIPRLKKRGNPFYSPSKQTRILVDKDNQWKRQHLQQSNMKTT